MNIQIVTQRLENYGTVEAPYWKCKGGKTFIVDGNEGAYSDSEVWGWMEEEERKEACEKWLAAYVKSLEYVGQDLGSIKYEIVDIQTVWLEDIKVIGIGEIMRHRKVG